ncbi:methylation-associated defense system restriction endonuclease subunit S MAD5, partial [Vibrio atlanticus]|uniref:methylation-associated defense system restriction endonuclease subunit S MAD5 n=1 Tax=Vibrio atlanticus TaxID=693153 RepID=UPI0035511A61
VYGALTLESLKCIKEPLRNITLGLVNAGRIKRVWAKSSEYGRPFLSSTDILKTDLSNIKAISHKAVEENPKLLIKQGWSLITRAGSIGKMSYCREDMDDMACTEDVLRVIPNVEKVEPGYLYAYLSSCYGLPLIISGTYGAIIQHIEPAHIADLPVPRLGDVENRVAELIDEAANARSLSAEKQQEAICRIDNLLGKGSSGSADIEHEKCSQIVSSTFLKDRFDAFYFSSESLLARSSFDCEKFESKKLSDVSEVFIPNIFKRLYSDDPEFGFPYITGADVFRLSPASDKYLLKGVATGNRLILEEGMIVVQEAGQLGGLIGRSVYVGKSLDGFACTNNMVRIKTYDKSDSGYLFALLSTEHGVRLIARESAGSSIPHIDEKRVKNIRIPWPNKTVRAEISALVMEGVKLRDRACKAEEEAKALVENAIEAAAQKH